MFRNGSVRLSLALVALGIGASLPALAAPVTPTYTGQLTADDTVVPFNFTTTSTLLYNFYTTSFSGGMNANGTTTAAGGFDPLLTLFNVTTGNVLGFSGSSGLGGTCGTAICDDANFSVTLAPGSYELALTEFPNGAVAKLADGFQFAGFPTITGDICGVAGGKFLESDVAPCVQRTANYAVNIVSSPVMSTTVTPEPPSWLLVLPAMSAAFVFYRRQLA